MRPHTLPSCHTHRTMGEANDAVYDAWFRVALGDSGGDSIKGKQAVGFFGRSGLDKPTLAKVWALADYDRGGALNRAKFGHAMSLIAQAQKGHDISGSSSKASPDLPQMQGLEALTENTLASFGNDASNPFDDDDDDDSMSTMSGSAPPSPMPAAKQPIISHYDKSKPKASKKKKKILTAAECGSIIDGLKHIYFTRIKKIEEEFKFGSFFSPCLTEGDFDAKPQILLLGQYSTGKTTFVKHLLKADYPGAHIGPEPTTDRFVVVHHGHEERRTPGNTLAVQPDKPFQGLSIFGSAFLGRLEGAQCANPLLENVTLVDTPGVLSGEKQRIERSYDFINVCEWFASRSDLILLLFDPYKLDISDEFKSVIHSIRGHDDKVSDAQGQRQRILAHIHASIHTRTHAHTALLKMPRVLTHIPPRQPSIHSLPASPGSYRAQQGRPGRFAAADARVRRADVVFRQGFQHA